MGKTEVMRGEIAAAPLSWYVVNTEPNRERVALAALRAAGFESYLPMRPVAKRDALTAMPLFPRYLFVRLDLDGPLWWKVFSTVGVASVITRSRTGGQPMPVPVPIGVIEAIQAKEVEGVVLLTQMRKTGPAPFRAGDKVRITAGPLTGIDGIFQSGDANRVMVLLAMMGRGARVELSTPSLRSIR